MVDIITSEDSKLTFQDGIAVLTFNRDDIRNALTGTSIIDDICQTVKWANKTDEVSVLIITGAGKAFSAGGNIKKMQNREGPLGGDVATIEKYYREGIQKMSLAMEQVEVPTIAAVNGPAIGAGFDLCCMCDLRIGSSIVKFGETFVNLGIVPGDGGSWFLSRLIGYQKAAELTFTGRIIDAAEALELGLLLKITEPDDLMHQAMELAQTIAAKPPQALRYAKRLLKKAERLELSDYLDLCAIMQGVCHNTDDHIEAVTAFIEKRKPVFKK